MIRRSRNRFTKVSNKLSQRMLDRGMRVTPAGKDSTIPPEIWQTNTQTKWSDPRLELSRKQINRGVNAKGLKHYELSSELFKKERDVFWSDDQDKSISSIPSTMNTLTIDSVLQARKKPDPRKLAPHPTQKKIQNLAGSLAASLTFQDEPRELVESKKSIASDSKVELPSKIHQRKPGSENPRRSSEKNFSDMLNLNLPPKRNDHVAAAELTSVPDQDWMYSSLGRSKLGMNLQGTHPSALWKGMAVNNPTSEDLRKQKSDLEKSVPRKMLDRHPDLAAWGLHEPFAPSAEIQRRLQTRDYANRKSAKERHTCNMRSSLFDEGSTEKLPTQAKSTPRSMGRRASYYQGGFYTGSPRSSKEMKLASMQSDIFGGIVS
eukprot:Filipodium_phascolosomae@DN1927_c0_g1_i10.p1